MASGTGALGGTAHCYRFWLGFTECRKSAEDPRLCIPERHDYMECLSREGLVSFRFCSAPLRVARLHCLSLGCRCFARAPLPRASARAISRRPRRVFFGLPLLPCVPARALAQKARIVAKARALEQEREAAKAGPVKAHAAH